MIFDTGRGPLWVAILRWRGRRCEATTEMLSPGLVPSGAVLRIFGTPEAAIRYAKNMIKPLRGTPAQFEVNDADGAE